MICVGEEQRRIEPKEHEARRKHGVGVAGEVVVSLAIDNAPKNCAVRPPRSTEEIDDREGDSNTEAAHRTEPGNANGGDEREDEFDTADLCEPSERW